MWKKPLICMFEATFKPGLVFPEDGVCDLSFFGALEKNHAFPEGERRRVQCGVGRLPGGRRQAGQDRTRSQPRPLMSREDN
ncbi:hypothetical protein MTO96_009527 [Rhipicephalus appendiculatus]